MWVKNQATSNSVEVQHCLSGPGNFIYLSGYYSLNCLLMRSFILENHCAIADEELDLTLIQGPLIQYCFCAMTLYWFGSVTTSQLQFPFCKAVIISVCLWGLLWLNTNKAIIAILKCFDKILVVEVGKIVSITDFRASIAAAIQMIHRPIWRNGISFSQPSRQGGPCSPQRCTFISWTCLTSCLFCFNFYHWYYSCVINGFSFTHVKAGEKSPN